MKTSVKQSKQAQGPPKGDKLFPAENIAEGGNAEGGNEKTHSPVTCAERQRFHRICSKPTRQPPKQKQHKWKQAEERNGGFLQTNRYLFHKAEDWRVQ